MHVQLAEIVEESIKLELNVADLYRYFSNIFTEDSDFWQKLSLEEENHAKLLQTGKEVLLSCDEFPEEVLAPTLQELVDTNYKLTSLLKELKDNPPSRESALDIAVSLEESAGEIHFQQAMQNIPISSNQKIFQDLNKEDKDHAIRIRAYKESFWN